MVDDVLDSYAVTPKGVDKPLPWYAGTSVLSNMMCVPLQLSRQGGAA
jgi:hypothetical protein